MQFSVIYTTRNIKLNRVVSYRIVVLRTQVGDLYVHIFNFTLNNYISNSKPPAPNNLALKSYLHGWFIQNLSKWFLNILVLVELIMCLWSVLFCENCLLQLSQVNGFLLYEFSCVCSGYSCVKTVCCIDYNWMASLRYEFSCGCSNY